MLTIEPDTNMISNRKISVDNEDVDSRLIFVHAMATDNVKCKITHKRYVIILDLTVVLNFAIDGVWINSLDDFGERFREKSVS